MDLSNLPTDPKALLVYLAVAGIGWFLRHKGILGPKSPTDPATPVDGPLLKLIKDRLAKRLAEKEASEADKTIKDLLDK